jgi:hypothetical protein
MGKTLTNLVSLALVFVAGIFISQFFDFNLSKSVEENESIIVLERIKKVAKLVTVEGHFSESYTHKEWNNYMGIDFNFGPFKKKARLKVTAKALIGFDLEKMTFTTMEDKKTLVISELPEPEILSIEPNIVYEDLYEGYLNSYTKEERTKLNKMATDFIRNKVLENKTLKESAVEQGYEILKIIELIAKDAGWEVVYAKDGKIPEMLKDSLPTIKG